ncbi:ABC transporter permease [bacterium]|nr:ABC transporter permease [bacterium]
MNITMLAPTAVKSIFRNRMRSFLTMLGIIIGVSAVIIMIAVGKGAQVEIERQIASLGSNLFIIFPHAIVHRGVNLGAGSSKPMTVADYEKLKDEAVYLKEVTPIAQTGGQIIGGGNNWLTQVQGVGDNYLMIRDWNMEYGCFFTMNDIKTRNKVAILGKTVSDNLFPDQDPVGSMIRIRRVPFKVIGVLSKKGQTTTGNDQDDIILVPYTTALYRLKGSQYINLIMASALSTEMMNEAQEEIRQILREAHNLNINEDDDFTVRNQTEITETASQASKTLTILLGSIAGVSLVVGGIGIMNIMLVSVTERTREIGLRMAVGARSVDVMMQFLIEAVALSMVGGMIGIILAFVTAGLLNIYSNFNVIIQPLTITLAATFSAIVGIFFGFYPARKAAMMNPIDALRYE